MSTQQAFVATLIVNGRNLGTWDASSGGGATGQTTKYRPGGNGAEIIEKGPISYDDLTLSKRYDAVNDQETIRWLHTVSGNNDSSASEQPVDATGAPLAVKPITRTGVVNMIDPGPTDSNTPDVRVVTLTMNVDAIA